METDEGDELGDETRGAFAEVVAGQLDNLIGQVVEALENDGLPPPPCGS